MFGWKWWEKTREKELRVQRQEGWRGSENNDRVVRGGDYSRKRWRREVRGWGRDSRREAVGPWLCPYSFLCPVSCPHILLILLPHRSQGRCGETSGPEDADPPPLPFPSAPTTLSLGRLARGCCPPPGKPGLPWTVPPRSSQPVFLLEVEVSWRRKHHSRPS